MKNNFSRLILKKYWIFVLLFSLIPYFGGGTRTTWSWLIISSARQAFLPTLGMIIILFRICNLQLNIVSILVTRIGLDGVFISGYTSAVWIIFLYGLGHIIMIIGLFVFHQVQLFSLQDLISQSLTLLFLFVCFLIFENTLFLNERNFLLIGVVILSFVYYFAFQQNVFKEVYF